MTLAGGGPSSGSRGPDRDGIGGVVDLAEARVTEVRPEKLGRGASSTESGGAGSLLPLDATPPVEGGTPYGPIHWSHRGYRLDSLGRRYMVDASGTRVTGFHGDRPPYVYGKVWDKMSKDEKDAKRKEFKEILDASKSAARKGAEEGSPPAPDGSAVVVKIAKLACPVGARALGPLRGAP